MAGRDAEVLAAECWAAGAVGIEEMDSALRVAFVDPVAAEQTRDVFAPGASLVRVDDHAGLDSHRDALVVAVAGRFAVHPPWLDPPAHLLGLAIDPGHAFGSGSHASTRLVLTMLADALAGAARVADIGCGSGVLAIAAARLGATVVAVDTDPAAVEATRANAAANGVTDRVETRLGSVEQLTGPVDLALANVTVDVHETIGPAIARRTDRTLVSGILAGPQLRRTAVAYKGTVEGSRTDGEWVAARLGRVGTVGME